MRLSAKCAFIIRLCLERRISRLFPAREVINGDLPTLSSRESKGDRFARAQRQLQVQALQMQLLRRTL